jgi:hypothetical protein
MKRYTPFLTAALVAGFAVSTMAQTVPTLPQPSPPPPDNIQPPVLPGWSYTPNPPGTNLPLVDQVANVNQWSADAVANPGENNSSVYQHGVNFHQSVQSAVSGNNLTVIQEGEESGEEGFDNQSFLWQQSRVSTQPTFDGSNEALIIQQGERNYLNVEQQNARNNDADLRQIGDDNLLVRAIDGPVIDMIDEEFPASQFGAYGSNAEYNKLDTVQRGDRNTIGLYQEAESSNDARINQTGHDNTLAVVQTGYDGMGTPSDSNVLAVKQFGVDNQAYLVQESDGDNSAHIWQEGDENLLVGVSTEIVDYEFYSMGLTTEEPDSKPTTKLDKDNPARQQAGGDSTLVLYQFSNDTPQLGSQYNVAGLHQHSLTGDNSATILQTVRGTNVSTNLSVSYQDSSTANNILNVNQIQGEAVAMPTPLW